MDKKRIGVLIGAGAISLVVITVVITILVMKGCGYSRTVTNGNGAGIESSAGEQDNVVSDNDSNTSSENTSGDGTQGATEKSTENSPEESSGNSPENSSENSSGNSSGGNSGEGSSTGNGVTASFNASNSWESGGKSFGQYALVVTNNSNADVTNWSIKLPIQNGLTVDNKWCCATEVSGNYIVIRPESYNAAIPKGANISNIGIVLRTDSAYTITAYSIEADGKTSDNIVADNNGSGNSSGSGSSSGSSSGNNSSSGSSSGGSTGNSSSGSSGSTNYTPATPPEAYGGLHVVGTKLVDAKGNEIQLKGPSTHGLQWFPQYVNKDTFKTFRDDWGANVIRLAMYAREGGYVGGDQAKLKTLINNGVEYATELGMYVIIDWHVLSYNPNETKNEAIAFFDEMAKKHANNPNVIYEICNEPTGAAWGSQIKPYAESLISTIRKHDNDALIIVGTNTWSQDVHEVVGNKIDDHNVMYALHFYAATHKDDLRNRMKAALDAGVPIFVSECSICDASGNGGIDYNSANAWIKLMDEYKVSYIAWNISNKNESSALIKSGNSKLSGWTVDELSETGKWWRKIFRGEY